MELEDADVSGAIYSIVRYKDDLYTQNGKIYKKASDVLLESHNWEEFDAPPVNSDYPYANKLAADETYLYVQVTKIDEDEEEGENVTSGSEVWCWKDEEEGWLQVGIPSGTTDEETGEEIQTTSFTQNKATLFCTNAVQPGHRYAYLRYNGAIYKLDGTSVEEVATGEEDNTTVPLAAARSCAYFGDAVYFSTESAMVTNETQSDDATYLYRVNDDDEIYYMSDGGEWSKWQSLGYDIFTLAVTNGDTTESGINALIAGTTSGIWILMFDDDGTCKGEVTSGFKNTSSTLSSYYRIHTSLVLDPSKTLSESTIYASADYAGSSSSTSASTKNRGLWSYLGETRTSWNRE